MKTHEPREVIAALVNELLYAKEDDNIQLSFEKPLSRKGHGGRRGKPNYNKGGQRSGGNRRGRDNGRPGRNSGGRRQGGKPSSGGRTSKQGRVFKDHQK